MSLNHWLPHRRSANGQRGAGAYLVVARRAVGYRGLDGIIPHYAERQQC